MSSVQRGTNQFRKTGIDDSELLDCTLFYVKDLGYKASALCNHGTAQLKVELLAGT
jgi:hypothetical protein